MIGQMKLAAMRAPNTTANMMSVPLRDPETQRTRVATIRVTAPEPTHAVTTTQADPGRPAGLLFTAPPGEPSRPEGARAGRTRDDAPGAATERRAGATAPRLDPPHPRLLPPWE